MRYHTNNPTLTVDMPKQLAIYIMASARNGTLYVGVTADLPKRATQHRENRTPGFAAKYNCRTLVYYEIHADMPAALAREKQLKAGSRFKKLALIESTNPTWRDLYEDF